MNSMPHWWRRNFLFAELLLAVISTAIVIVVIEAGWPGTGIAGFVSNDETRRLVYSALASVFGSLFGFAITAASIVLGFSSTPRLRIIHEAGHFTTIWSVFFSTIRAVGLSTILSIVGLIAEQSPMVITYISYALMFAVLLSVLRLMRTVWVLEKTIRLMTTQSSTGRNYTKNRATSSSD
jgi:hypothetical protein